MNIVDLIICAILGLSIISGMHKGFITSTLATVGFFGSWLGANALYSQLAAAIQGNASLMNMLRYYIDTSSLFQTVGLASANAAESITSGQLSQALAELILGISQNKYVVLLLINIFLFIVGMLMETLAAIIILTPILLPVVTQLGVDPIHFGVIMVVNLVIGMCTPPVGVNLFVGCRLGGITVDKMVKWLIPLVGSLLVVLMIVTYVPVISTFLPDLFNGVLFSGG